ncbi:LOW QUALITY PROTEIN: hypothetical protein CVT26_000037 [Gymnopilus dilepis]|uniref:Derlin n=1 Tax=Gymnopilus dilepis TaxID=231916 RepID=A0A409VGL7_9AGAR|nr:LOW QUALITY PROTEIN: hypothetical protein CVT26_000037 [Gymnopilus dilepis]
MPVGIEAWITQIPPITRGWLALSVLISLAVQSQLVTPLQLYFSPRSAFINGQPWRMVTTFFYFGPISLDFVFHLFFFMRYSRMLEESSFANKRADYFWLLLQSAVLLLRWADYRSFARILNLDALTALQLTLPLLLARICSYLSMVSPASVNADIALWFGNNYSAVPASGFSRFFMDSQRDMEGGGWRPGGMRCRPRWFLRDVWTREMVGGKTVFSDAPVRLKRLFGDQ